MDQGTLQLIAGLLLDCEMENFKDRFSVETRLIITDATLVTIANSVN